MAQKIHRIVMRNGTQFYDRLMEIKSNRIRLENEGWMSRTLIEEFWPERPAFLKDGKLVLGLPKPTVVRVVPVPKPPVPKLLVERPKVVPTPRISIASEAAASPRSEAATAPQAYANKLLDGRYVVTLVGLSMEDVVKVKHALGILTAPVVRTGTGMKRLEKKVTDTLCDFCGEIFQSKREYKDSSKKRCCGQVVCKRAYQRWYIQKNKDKQKVLTL